MVREIVHDPLMLARKSEEASAEDAPVAVDLMDTLKVHRDQGASIYHGSNTIYRKYCFEKGKLTNVSS